MAATMLMKANLRASIQFMSNSVLTLPLTNASSLLNQTKTEALQFPSEQQPQLAGSPRSLLGDFHMSNQRVIQSLGFGQAPAVFSIQDYLKSQMETRGPSKQKIEEEDEDEDEDMDELDDENEADLTEDSDAESLFHSDEDGDLKDS